MTASTGIKSDKTDHALCIMVEWYGIFVIDDEPSPPQCWITLRAGESSAMAR